MDRQMCTDRADPGHVAANEACRRERTARLRAGTGSSCARCGPVALDRGLLSGDRTVATRVVGHGLAHFRGETPGCSASPSGMASPRRTCGAGRGRQATTQAGPAGGPRRDTRRATLGRTSPTPWRPRSTGSNPTRAGRDAGDSPARRATVAWWSPARGRVGRVGEAGCRTPVGCAVGHVACGTGTRLPGVPGRAGPGTRRRRGLSRRSRRAPGADAVAHPDGVSGRASDRAAGHATAGAAGALLHRGHRRAANAVLSRRARSAGVAARCDRGGSDLASCPKLWLEITPIARAEARTTYRVTSGQEQCPTYC